MPSERIAFLPEKAIKRLRASVCYHEIHQVVEELVSNSIDAGATHIRVEVDAEQLQCRVSDDGQGIAEADFPLVARHHHTSKLTSLRELEEGPMQLGFRGEALACLSEVSVLEITSKGPNSFRTQVKVLRGGEVVQQGAAPLPQVGTGTTVTVRDFLYNQPVKRSLAKRNGRREIESCRQSCLRLGLVHPHIALTLLDARDGSQALHLTRDRRPEDVLAAALGAEHLEAVRTVSASCVGPCGAAMSVQGYAVEAPRGYSSRGHQFMYVNGRPVISDRLTSPIQELFTRIAGGLRSRQAAGRPPAEGSGLPSHLPSGWKHPGFILNLVLPPAAYDITFEPGKTAVQFMDPAPVLGLLGSAVGQAWRRALSDTQMAELSAAPPAAGQGGGGNTRSAAAAARAEGKLRRLEAFLGAEGGEEAGPGLDMDSGPRVGPGSGRGRGKPPQDKGRSHGGFAPRPFVESMRLAPCAEPGPSELGRTGPAHHNRGGAAAPVAGATSNGQHPRPQQAGGPVSWPLAGRNPLRPQPWSPQQQQQQQQLIPQHPRPQADFPRAPAAGPSGRAGLGGPQRAAERGPLSRGGRGLDAAAPSLSEPLGEFEPFAAPRALFPDPEPPIRFGSPPAARELEGMGLQQGPGSLAGLDCSPSLPFERHRGPPPGMASDSPSAAFWSEVECRRRPAAASQPGQGLGGSSPGLGLFGPASAPDLVHRLRGLVQGSGPGERPPSLGTGPSPMPGQPLSKSWRQVKAGGGTKAPPALDLIQGDDAMGDLPGLQWPEQRPAPQQVAEQQLVQPVQGAPAVAGPTAPQPPPPPPKKQQQQQQQQQRASGPGAPSSLVAQAPPPVIRQAAGGSAPPPGPVQDLLRPDQPAAGGVGPPMVDVPTALPPQLDSGRVGAGAVPPRPPVQGPQVLAQPPPAAPRPQPQPQPPPPPQSQQVQVGAPVPVPAPILNPALLAPPEPPAGLDGIMATWRARYGHGGPGGSAGPGADLSLFAAPDLAALSGWTGIPLVPGHLTRQHLQAAAAADPDPESESGHQGGQPPAARVLPRQLDRRFLLVVSGGGGGGGGGLVLSAVDQHAADERVRLEELTSEVLRARDSYLEGPWGGGDYGQNQVDWAPNKGMGAPPPLSSSSLEAPLLLELSHQEAAALEARRQEIKAWGWRLEAPARDGAAAGPPGPSVWVLGCPVVLGTPVAPTELRPFLVDGGAAAGSRLATPGPIAHILASKACRGAIMFGDRLSPPEARALVAELSRTALCFACAHGRPTAAPLMDLGSLAACREALEAQAAAVEDLPGGAGAAVRRALGPGSIPGGDVGPSSAAARLDAESIVLRLRKILYGPTL